MSDFKFNYDSSCRTKDVYIELPQFEKFHRNDKTDELIGRKKLLNRIEEQINNESVKNRAILVTGFRGGRKNGTR